MGNTVKNCSILSLIRLIKCRYNESEAPMSDSSIQLITAGGFCWTSFTAHMPLLMANSAISQVSHSIPTDECNLALA